MDIEAASGELRVGGRVCARLTGISYSQERGAAKWVIHAKGSEIIAAWLSRPVEVRLNIGKAIWCWRDGRARLTGEEIVVEGESQREALR